MKYLIGGPPRCGKTTLAKELSSRLGVSWISTDMIDNMLKPYLSAGGRVTDLFGNEQRYDSNLNGALITNKIVHEDILKYL